jgi:hypothetical protein
MRERLDPSAGSDPHPNPRPSAVDHE